MKIEINFDKKPVLFLAAFIIGLAIVGLVVAYTDPWGPELPGNSSGPPVVGHSADETNVYIGGTLKTLQQAIDAGDFGGGTVSGWSCTDEFTTILEIPDGDRTHKIIRLKEECMNANGCKMIFSKGELDSPSPEEALVFEFLQNSNNFWFTSRTGVAPNEDGTNGNGIDERIMDQGPGGCNLYDEYSGQALAADEVYIWCSSGEPGFIYLCN
ncbi:MAG: hypothetical protein ABID38_06225 [Candidatus Diapherotrites archaeon]